VFAFNILQKNNKSNNLSASKHTTLYTSDAALISLFQFWHYTVSQINWTRLKLSSRTRIGR